MGAEPEDEETSQSSPTVEDDGEDKPGEESVGEPAQPADETRADGNGLGLPPADAQRAPVEEPELAEVPLKPEEGDKNIVVRDDDGNQDPVAQEPEPAKLTQKLTCDMPECFVIVWNQG